MGYAVSFVGADDGDDGPFDLCSVGGWTLLGRWVGSLPEGGPAALRELVTEGRVSDTRALAGDLQAALEAEPPDNSAVAETARSLLELIGTGDPDETAVVTDGEGP